MNFISNLIGFNRELIKGYVTIDDEGIIGSTEKMWLIYSGERKKDKLPVSLFVLKKQKLLNRSDNSDQISAMFKKEAQNLVKLRHPSFLPILEPVHEDQKQIVYVTERIESTLQLVLKEKKMSQLNDDLQLKVNLKSIVNGLDFLNNDLQSVHLNLSPENIFITATGEWKIGGMMFLRTVQKEDSMGYTKLDPSLSIKPNYTYTSFSHLENINLRCDLFSFTIVLYHIFAVLEEKKVILLERLSSQKEALNHLEQIVGINKKPFMEVFPIQLLDLVGKILKRKGSCVGHSDFLENKWFDDIRLKIIDYFSVFITKTEQEQKDFLCILSRNMEEFKPKLIVNMIIPFLNQHKTKENIDMFVLSALLLIAEKKLIEPKDIR